VKHARMCGTLYGSLVPLMLALHSGLHALAQEMPVHTNDAVVINCAEEVALEVLVDYVGQTLDLRFLYGEELTNKRVELRPSPVEIPRSHLLRLLASLLRVRDLVMVEESPGFYRIVRAEQTTRSAVAILGDGSDLDPTSLRMITQILAVPSGNIEGLSEKLSRFMSHPKSGLVTVPEKGLLIVTDYESRIALLQELIGVLDAGCESAEVRIVNTRCGDPSILADQVSTIMAETHRISGSAVPPLSVLGDVIPAAIVVVGTTSQITEAESLIESLSPAATELVSNTYTPRYLSVDRFYKLIENVTLAPGSGVPPPIGMYQDTQSGRLFVTAEPATHAAIASLLDTEDCPLPQTRRPLRVYRPKNRRVAELLATLSELLGEGTGISGLQAMSSPESQSGPSARQSRRESSVSRPVQLPPMPPVEESIVSVASVQGPDYVLTMDEHTNSIIAIGTREFHGQLESLIDELDRRRPQVLIEMKLVAVTMSDSQELGIELESLDLGDGWDYLLFSSFGLSTINLATGMRELAPGPGANGILLGPEQVPIVLKALATRGMARVMSTPKLLVSDNARGVLRNVDEAPFTSVNASDTVATTSFGGFESAGTTLSVTPHISEGDHLTLEFELTFSNFTGAAASGSIPPPRTTNSFSSTVEVPDGYTVITGGLAVDNDSDSTSEVPHLGRIPLLGRLFQSNTQQKTKTKIYAFIRPVILREDKFAALKHISLSALEAADLAPKSPPPGEPLWMN